MYDVTRKYKEIPIGVQGENLSREIQFDIHYWIDNLGEGTVMLVHQRMGDTDPYPCVTTVEDGIATWKPSSADTRDSGYGMLVVSYVVSGVIAKTVIFQTLVYPSLGEVGDVPEAYQAWVDSIIAAAGEAQEARQGAEEAEEGAEDAKTAIENMSATGSVDNHTGAPSVVVTKSTVDDHINLDFAFHNMKGDTGRTGDTGPQGPEGPRGPQGYKGETGESGVYVGDENPGPLPGQNVWIDPDGEASGVLPLVSSADNGKILKVVGGQWDKAEGGGSGKYLHTILEFPAEHSGSTSQPSHFCIQMVTPRASVYPSVEAVAEDIWKYAGAKALYTQEYFNDAIIPCSGYIFSSDASVQGVIEFARGRKTASGYELWIQTDKGIVEIPHFYIYKSETVIAL